MSAPQEEVEAVRELRAQRGNGVRQVRQTPKQRQEAEKAAAEHQAVANRIAAEFAGMKTSAPAAWGILQSFHRMVKPPSNYTGSECAVWREGVRAMQDYMADQAMLWEQQK